MFWCSTLCRGRDRVYFLNGNYLDYNVLASDRSSGQHIGIILVELGVGITVATVMIALYHSFASFRIKDD